VTTRTLRTRDPPGRPSLSPRQETKREGLPEGHEAKAPIRLGSEEGVWRVVRFGSVADVSGHMPMSEKG